jgi:hypothetical protein
MRLEQEYLKETEQLCARIVAEGGYEGVDAQLWMEVYGPVHEEAQRLFEARLAQQRAFAEREQATLSTLSGKPKE